MQKINILPPSVSSMIAAGEVVERPASVAKELIENSIDAGAKRITVEIKGAPSSFLRVSDDGHGIPKDDVPKAFLRYATSKLQKIEDLDTLLSMGFRGEALAAISSVARVEMLTLSQDEHVGVKAVCIGGVIEEMSEAGCPKGTTIIVRDLFFNTPARLKFLKRDATEAAYVIDVCRFLAAANPDVSVSLIRDGEHIFKTAGDGDLKSAIYEIFKKDVASSLIEVGYDFEGIGVSGYISSPAYSRANKSMQHFFLNGRYIKSSTLSAALMEGYKDSIMTKKFPAAFLFLSIDPAKVDINVHPSKMEVKFENDRTFFSAVYFAVKSALSKGDERPQINLTDVGRRADVPSKVEPPETYVDTSFFERRSPQSRSQPERGGRMYVESIKAVQEINDFTCEGKHESVLSSFDPGRDTIEIIRKTPEALPDTSDQGQGGFAPPDRQGKEPPIYANDAAAVAGEVFDTYIIAQLGEDMFLIDKHAAHERIIYERLMAGEAEAAPQQLLQPVNVPISPSLQMAIMENIEIISDIGFVIEEFGVGSLLVRAVPVSVLDEDIDGLIAELAEQLSLGKSNLRLKARDEMIYMVACKAAQKAKQKTSLLENEALVNELFLRTDIMYCPHGRPVAVKLSKKEIEKRFGRIV